MRSIVLDTSAALKLVRPEDGSTEVAALVADRLAAGIVVPPIFWLELVNVLSRRHAYSGASVVEAVHHLVAMGLQTLEIGRPALLAIIDLVERHDLSAYDAAYLALADSLDAELATADRRLALAAGDRGLFIGPDQGIAEERAAYCPREPTWPSWPGAGAYLAELRSAL